MRKNILSIIVPYFNYPQGLVRLLNSIPRMDSIQVIVINDRSDKYIDEYNRIRDLYADENILFINNNGEKGAGSCRNQGLKMHWENGYYLQISMIFLLMVFMIR